MKIKIIYILTLIMLGLSSCKKEEIVTNKSEQDNIEVPIYKDVTITYHLLSGGYPSTLPVKCDVYVMYESLIYPEWFIYPDDEEEASYLENPYLFSLQEVYQEPITLNIPTGTEVNFILSVSMLQVGGFYAQVYEGSGVTYLITIEIEGEEPIEYYGPSGIYGSGIITTITI